MYRFSRSPRFTSVSRQVCGMQQLCTRLSTLYEYVVYRTHLGGKQYCTIPTWGEARERQRTVVLLKKVEEGSWKAIGRRSKPSKCTLPLVPARALINYAAPGSVSAVCAGRRARPRSTCSAAAVVDVHSRHKATPLQRRRQAIVKCKGSEGIRRLCQAQAERQLIIGG